MKRILCGLGLWCAYVFAFAGNSDTGNFTDSSIASTDISMKYLSQLFGNVSGALPGSGSDLLGHIFYVLNQGIMVVAAVWLVFTIFNMVLNAGLEGSFNNPQKKGVMIMFRIAVGLAMLVPSSNTGYSAIQTVMMKIVVQGVRLADEMWDYSLDYLANGGVIYAAPGKGQLTMKQLTPYMDVNGKSQPMGIVQQVYNAEVCMYLSNRYNKLKSDSNVMAKNAAQSPYRMISVQPFLNKDGSVFDGAVFFPGYGDSTPYRPGGRSPNPKLYAQSCGWVVPTNKLGDSKMQLMQYQQSFAALNQLAIDLMPLAKRQANSVPLGSQQPTSSSMLPAAGGQVLSNAVLDYMTQIKPYANYLHSKAQKSAKAFVPNAKKQGWFAAGNFYWDLARLNDAMNAATDLSGYTPIPNGAKSMPEQLTNAIALANNSLGDGAATSIWGSGIHNLQQYTAGLNSGEVQSSTGVGKSHAFRSSKFATGGIDFGWIIQTAFSDVVTKFVGMTSNPAASTFYDPLDFVQQLGRSCLESAGSIWATVMGLIVATSALSGICTAALPGGTISQAIFSWMTPLWTMSATGMFVAGFMLTFYAPLYPYLLFLFGAIGWLLYVVESMVAAPLVCFGMTHPEGHDFMGRAEQAMMLALGVFLRPVLMVIGFMVAILMSYIGFSIVNYGFGQILASAFGGLASGSFGDGSHHPAPMGAIWSVVAGGVDKNQGTHFTGHDLSDFLLIPLLMIAYGLIVIEVVNQCFSMIHQLPDTVLRWIGMAPQQDQTERYAQAIKSGVQSGAQEGARAAGQGVTGISNPAVIGGRNAKQLANMGGRSSMQNLNSGGDGGAGGGAAAAGGAAA